VGEGGPGDRRGDRLPALVRGCHDPVNLSLGPHVHQVGHPQQPGVDSRGVLYF
jgi:hypothetical protein